MTTGMQGVRLLIPDVERDAPFAYEWFARPEGRDTLLRMGNAESEIEDSTLDGERKIMQEFLDLEKENKQVTRVITINNETIGVVWIELFKNHDVEPPSVHIMIGDPDYRRKGIGRFAMNWAIDYVRNQTNYKIIHTRHLANNIAIAELNRSLGFTNIGDVYTDDNGLTWQKVGLVL
jgi:RimJ/RimL family protein N-acetyltransferase